MHTYPISHRAERGQTIPFWLFTTLTVLALMFFMMNYSNTIRWQVRAQNAADSSAAAKLAGDAAILNSSTLLLYALDLQNVKVQTLVQTVVNLASGGAQTGGCGVLGLQSPCGLASYVDVVQGTVTNLSDVNSLVSSVPNALGQLSQLAANPEESVNQLAGQSCVQLSTDCAFKYDTIVTAPSGLLPLTVKIDEIACKKIPGIAIGFLKIGAPFYAIGHASMTLSPLSNVLNPATGGTPDLPISGIVPNLNSAQTSALGLNLNALSVNFGILLPEAVPAVPLSPAQLNTIETSYCT